MAGKTDIHRVLPNSGGGWDIKRDGDQRASKHFDTKQAAVDAAREISRNQKTELAIHNADGKIAGRDSHGNDPRSSKG